MQRTIGAVERLAVFARPGMSEHFIGASIQPVEGTIDPARMSVGEPGLPREFLWKRKIIKIERVLRTWRENGDCHHGSGERYLRKHWFEVMTKTGERMKIYFERQGRSAQQKSRWHLYTLEDARLSMQVTPNAAPLRIPLAMRAQ